MSDSTTATRNPDIRKNFTKVPNQLIERRDLTTYEKLIVIYVLSYKECYTGQRKMSTDLSISRSSVHRALINLMEKRIVRKVHKDGWSYFYVVNPFHKWK